MIFRNSYGQHFTRLKSVLSLIAEAGVRLKPDKRNFLQSQISYLGQVISEDEIKTDPKKIEKVVNWETPGCYADLHSFIAFCNYYRKFIRDFASIAQPLENLLKQDTGKINGKYSKRFVIWDTAGQTAFKELKRRLTEAPVLAYPTKTGEFILDTDASHYHIGGILSQIQDGKEKVIAYTSKKLTNTELKYCVTRKELLAVYIFVKQFKQFKHNLNTPF